MATTSLWPIHNTGSRGVKSVVKQLVKYASNEEKTVPGKTATMQSKGTMQSVMGYVSKDEKVNRDHQENRQDFLSAPGSVDAESDDDACRMILGHLAGGSGERRYVTGINCFPETAVEEMMITKKRWPERGNRLLFHGYQSFMPGEVTPDQAHRISVQLARELWGDRFEIVVATHLDRDHIHSHFVINTVSFLNGRKFIWDKEYPRMQKRSDELCRAESLSVVPSNGNLEMKLHKGAARAEAEGRPTIQSIVKEDVDCCIREASTLEEWISLMRGKGYQIDDSHKYLRIFPYGHSRCIRLDRRFGEAYSLDGIASQIEAHGMQPEHKQKTEEEAVKEIYRELAKRGKRKYITKKNPTGIQRRYLVFLFRIGYHKTPAQIARTHYLLREELTKLDRYIEESKFLIYEDIDTLEQLKERKLQDQAEINMLYRSRINLQKMLPFSNEVEKESALGQISRIEDEIRKMRRNLQNEKGILKRMGEIEHKEKIVKEISAGQSMGQRKGPKSEERQRAGKGGRIYG
ncbi:MAG: relaxase/mobilization nuclease domain-containing protein [Eubacterium sp.]|nr:relaxase/mobilization nuclease domain-containing protein [Eubacterium sp.]